MSGTIPFQAVTLKQLPQHIDDIWQGGIIRFPPLGVDDDGKPVGLEVCLWISFKARKAGPSPENCQPGNTRLETVLNSLVAFATDPALTGYRPGLIEVSDAPLANQLADALAVANIRVEHVENLDGLQGLLDDFEDAVDEGVMIPGPLEDTGVTLDRLRAFAAAAAAFFEAAPWRHLSNDDLVEIESPKADPTLRFAVVLGRAGREFGLGLYASADHFWKTYEGLHPEELLKLGPLWSLSFDPRAKMPVADLEIWTKEQLPVCRQQMYPLLVQNRLENSRRADAAALTYVEGLMRALTATTEEDLDAGRWTKRVEAFDGPAEYVLSLPFQLRPPTFQDLFRRGLMPDRRALEAQAAEVDRFLEGKNLKTIDAINKAIDAEFNDKPVDRTKYLPRNALEQAQALCYEAFEAFGRRRSVLARQALKVCPDCADAYVLLAEAAGEPAEAMAFYMQGVEAGRRALGEAPFKEAVGEFWGRQSTRPFMRALFGLGTARMGVDDVAGAIADYQELLRLNPLDNQGVRYVLLPLLISEAQDEAATHLVAAYEGDIGAAWLYSRALLAFRKDGDTEPSRRLLHEALEQNRHVPKYLLGRQEADFWPQSYAPGSDEEAIIAADECEEAWEATPDALDWLDEQAARFRKAGRNKKSNRKDKRSQGKKRGR